MVDRPDGDVAASRYRHGNDEHQGEASLPDAEILLIDHTGLSYDVRSERH
jgi:hypothetical protein